MRADNRAKLDKIVKNAKTGDEKAVHLLRLINIKLCCDAPVPALIKFVETLNDIYVDEQIAFAESEAAATPEVKEPTNAE